MRKFLPDSLDTKFKKDKISNYGDLWCGAVAQSVERPSKVPVWCNSTDVGSNPGAGVKGGRKTGSKKILAAPSDECRKNFQGMGEKQVMLASD